MGDTSPLVDTPLAMLAKFQLCSWLLVAEAAGGPKSCTTAEVGGNTVGQIGRRTIVVDKMHE